MIRFKEGIDVLGMLARAGFTSYYFRKTGEIGQAEIQKIRSGGLPSWNTLDFICRTLRYQPGELLECVDDGYWPEESKRQ